MSRLTYKYYTENYISKNKFELVKSNNYRSYIDKINKEMEYIHKKIQVTNDKNQIKEYKDILNFFNKRKSEIIKINR